MMRLVPMPKPQALGPQWIHKKRGQVHGGAASTVGACTAPVSANRFEALRVEDPRGVCANGASAAAIPRLPPKPTVLANPSAKQTSSAVVKAMSAVRLITEGGVQRNLKRSNKGSVGAVSATKDRDLAVKVCIEQQERAVGHPIFMNPLEPNAHVHALSAKTCASYTLNDKASQVNTAAAPTNGFFAEQPGIAEFLKAVRGKNSSKDEGKYNVSDWEDEWVSLVDDWGDFDMSYKRGDLMQQVCSAEGNGISARNLYKNGSFKVGNKH